MKTLLPIACLFVGLNLCSMDRCEFATHMADYEKRIKEAISKGGEQYVMQHPETSLNEIIEKMKEAGKQVGKHYKILGKFNYVDIAVETRNCILAKALLSKGAKSKKALHIASRKNDCRMLEILLKFMNVNSIFFGDTALHTAIMYDAVEATEFLIQQGANKAIQNIFGETPLAWLQRQKTPNLQQTKIIALLEHNT